MNGSNEASGSARSIWSDRHQLKRIVPAVFVVCLMLLSPLVLLTQSGDFGSGLDATEQKHKITYHYNPDGSGTSVGVYYYGIAATEYNPAYWTSSLDSIYAANNADVVGTRTVWEGQSANTSVSITSLPVTQEYMVRLDNGKLYFSYDGDTVLEDGTRPGHDLGLSFTNIKGQEVLRIYLDDDGITPKGVIQNTDPQYPNDIRPSSTQYSTWEDRFKYTDSNSRFKLSYWVEDNGAYVYSKFQTLNGTTQLIDLTDGEYKTFGLLFNAMFDDGFSIDNVSIQKVFGGWTTIKDYDCRNYPEGIIYPGDVVSEDVTKLYAVWLYPDIKIPQEGFTSVTQVQGNKLISHLSLNADSLRAGIQPYIGLSSLNVTESDMVGVYHYDYDLGKYVVGASDSDYSMFSTIYQIEASELIQVSTKTTIPSGTYRSANPDDVNTIGINASILMGGDVVIDNLLFKQMYYDNNNRLGDKASYVINANYHRLIIGTNVDVDKGDLNYQKQNDPTYKGELLLAPYVVGGSGSNTSTSIEDGKRIVSVAGTDDSSRNHGMSNLQVDIATFVIVHSGTYAHISAGPPDGTIGSDNRPLSTYVVIKDATVMGIVGGSAGQSIVNGSMYDGQGANDGGTFVYCCGLKSTGDMYEDLATGFDNDAHNYFYADESSVVQGGSRIGKVYGSTHLFLSGRTSVFDAQAGGRSAESYCEHTYIEITGKAEVRHVACGTITDGASRNQNYQSVGGVDIYVAQNPIIATLLGAGYDTWFVQNYATMVKGEINIEISGGLIGYVYGGGMRGTIGTTDPEENVDIHIKMTGGTVKYDLFGGGRGGLDKIHHKAKMADGSQPDGSLGRWDKDGTASCINQTNSTGFSKVFGDVSIEITGGRVEGNVYGGGESTPALKDYMGVYDMSASKYGPTQNVAKLEGDVSIVIDGGAEILGDVYGAGKGIAVENGKVVLEYVDVVTASGYTGLSEDLQRIPYYSALIIHAGGEDGSFRFIPWMSGSNATIVDHTGVVTYHETANNLSTYVDYARVNGTTDVVINGGKVWGSVYGGGAMGLTNYEGDSSTTSVTIHGGEIVGSVYGGGLGTLGSASVNGHSSVQINGGTVGDSVYGGSAYGITDSTSVSITGTAHLSGDVYGGGLGASGYLSVRSDSSVSINGTSDSERVVIIGTVYGGSAYGINNGDVIITLANCKVNGNVYGGGLGASGYQSVKGKRTIKMNSGEVTMNIFGGSSDGDDGVSGTLTSDSLVVITEGTVGGSVYGGGLLGKTYGDTTIYIGYVQNDMGNYVPTPSRAPQAEPVITIADSVYAGGEVDTTGESSAAYTEYLVMGGGRVFVDGEYSDVSIKGSIMGSGNACLTKGTTAAILDHFNDPVEMAGLHRFTSVNLITSLLDIDGRDSIVGSETKKCSLSNIGTLTLTDSSTLLISNHVDNIGAFESMNKDDKPTTAASPFNKVIFKAGSTMFIRSIEKVEVGNVDDYRTTYGMVSGYTVLSVATGNVSYGGYVLGSENSTGGFMILKGGSYSVADRSKFSSGVYCWFISGVETKIASLNLTYNEQDPGAVVSEATTVDIAKLQNTSNMKYTGGMFIPSAEYTLGELESRLRFDLGYVDAIDRDYALVYVSGGETPTYGIQYQSTQSEDKYLDTGKIQNSTFTPYTGESRAGVFTLNLKFTGVPDGSTRYLGYLNLHFQEVNEISYQTPSGEIQHDIMITNKVELKVDLYMVGTTVEDEYHLNLWTVDNAGSVNMIFPDKLFKQSIHVLSISSPEHAPAITMETVLNDGNTTGWLLTGDAVVRSTYHDDSTVPTESTPLLDIGTLSGSYMGSMKISISDPVADNSVYHIRLVMKDQYGNFIMENGKVKEVMIYLTVKARNDVKVTFYDYMHGVKRETGGIDRTYSYGTQLTDADCPNVSENFLGWYTDENFVNVFNFSTPLTKNMELFARYSYAVTFDYQDGTTSKLYLASNLTGVTVTEPIQPTKTGFEFGGWYKQSKCIEQWDFENDLINSDITLYAKWTGQELMVLFKPGEHATEYLDYVEIIDGKVVTPIVNYGGTFEVLDLRYCTPEAGDVTILDVARDMVLQEYAGMTFIRWQIKVDDQWVPIYEDTKIDANIIDIDHAPVSPTYHVKTIELVALTSPVAIQVEMTTGVDDVSAVVDAPSSFLVYPQEKSRHTEGGKTYHTYWFEYTLNDATRSGYYLKYWHNPKVTVDPLYPPAGLTRIMQIEAVEEPDGHIYALTESLIINGQPRVIDTYAEGTKPMDDTSEQNVYKVTYVANWALIDYKVTINDPVHGMIDAFKVDVGQNNELVLTRGNSFTVHYGDRIKVVFTPNENYQFYKWTYEGECIIEDDKSNVTTIVVTGDAAIQANDTGERITRIYMSLNNTAAPMNSIFFEKDGEYAEFTKNPISDQTGKSLYVGYLVAGEYTVCIIENEIVYDFGTITVGDSDNVDNTFDFEVYSLSIGDVAGEPNIGILDYSKYVGRSVDSGTPLFGKVTVSKGFTYRLSEGYYDDPTDRTTGYHEIRELGIDENGAANDVDLVFQLYVDTLKDPRFIVGYVRPVVFTVTFEIGDGTTSEGLRNWNINHATNYNNSIVWEYRYDHDFSTPVNGLQRMPTMSDFETVAGSLNGYIVFHWYIRYDGEHDEFDGAVYEDTVLDAAFLNRLTEREGNSFKLVAWIVYPTHEVDMAVETYVQNVAGTGYEYVDSSVTPVIAGAQGSYLGVFTIRSLEGFNWIRYETEGMDQGSTITKHEEDYKATIYTSLNHVKVKLYYDRMTTVVELDPSGATVTDESWTWDEVSGKYKKTVRFGETVQLPIGDSLVKDNSEFIAWINSSGRAVPDSTYTVTLSDVESYAAHSTPVRFAATFEATNAHTLTLLTSLGHFENGLQRVTMQVTPDQFIPDIVEFPQYEGGEYQLTDQKYLPTIPETLDRDLTLVAQWTVTPYPLNLSIHSADEGATHIAVSGTHDSSSPFAVTLAEPYNGSLPHHSEITITIRMDPGYDLNIEDTVEGLPAAVGQPEELSGGKGYRWTFFLDQAVTIEFHTKKAMYDIYYIVNDSLYQTDHVVKYGTETLINPDMTGYTWNGKWYTDKACTVEYTQTQFMVLESVTLYTKATPTQYTVNYHSNNALAYTASETFKYGEERTLRSFSNVEAFNQPGYVMVGWSDKPTNNTEKGELKYSLEEKVKNLSSTGGTIDFYAYYVKVECDTDNIHTDIVYGDDPDGYGMRVVKSSGSGTVQNLVVYYSTSVLSSQNYTTGSTTSPMIKNAGTHYIFYYGWVWFVNPDGSVSDQKRSFISGYVDIEIERKPVTFVSGSVTRSYSAEDRIYYEHIDSGMNDILSGDRSGISFVFTYNSTNGPKEPGTYSNTFRVVFDGVNAIATNYIVTYSPGNLVIDATEANITVVTSQSMQYGQINKSLDATSGSGDLTYTIYSGGQYITLNNDNTINAIGAGSATVKISLSDTAYKFVAVTVEPKPITVTTTLSSSVKVYDGTSSLLPTQVLTVTGITGILAGDTDLVSVTPVGTYTDGYGNATANAGDSVPIAIAYTIGGTKGANYQIDDEHSTVSVAGQITPKAVTIRPASATKVYDGQELTSSNYTADGFINNNGIATITMSASSTITNVGHVYNNIQSYTLLENTIATNYTITTVDDTATLTVTQRTVTIPTSGIALYYTGMSIAAPVETNEWYEEDTTDPRNVRSAVEVGNYQVVLNLIGNDAQNTNVVWSDSTTETKLIDWSIRSSNLNYNLFVMSEGEKYYNGTAYDNILMYTPVEGGIDYIPYDPSTGQGDYIIVYPEDNVNAGDKTVRVVGMNGYAQSPVLEYDYTILKRVVSVTYVQDQKFLYDGQPHSPVFTYTGILDSDIASGGVRMDMTGTGQTVYREGGYTSVLMPSGDKVGNYVIPETIIQWSIEKRIVYIAAESDWDTKSDTPITNSGYRATGILEEDQAAFRITVQGAQTGVGSSANTVTCEVLDAEKADNYEIHLINGTLIMSCSANDISFISTSVETER